MATDESHLRLPASDLERIERFRKAAYGGAVADALAGLGITHTVLAATVKPVRTGAQVVGRAIPVRAAAAGSPNLPSDVLDGRQLVDPENDVVPQREVMRAIATHEPGSVVCYYASGDTSEAHFGELSAALAYASGCRGIVMFGNLRDVARIVQLPDFPAFTTGSSPHALGQTEIISVDEPAPFPGRDRPYVYIQPGDFIFGDDDGVIVIPEAVVDEVLHRVELLTSREARERELISAGMEIDDVYKTIGIL